MELEKNLRSLGLSENESKLYIHALTLGSFSVTEISAASGFKRPTCYLILDELTKRGLVSIVPYSSKLTYSAESPDIFLAAAEDHILDIKKILPDLHALQKDSRNRPTIKFYQGQNGIHTVYNDVLKSSITEYNYVGSIEETLGAVGKDFLDNWAKRRIKKGLRSKGVRVIDSAKTKHLYLEEADALRETRYAPSGLNFLHTFLLYDNKVAVISTKRDGFAFIVENKDFYLSMKSFFEALWLISAPFAEINKPAKKSA